jgi:V/A-type H+-transporting ATPase subunit C
MPPSAGTDWDAGNAALRARRSKLLAGPALLNLLGRSLDEVIGALADTDWRVDVEAALTRYTGLRVLQEAARTRLARQLGRVRALYGGEAREALDLRVSRYDIDNVVTILRGQARALDPDQLLPMLVPAGRLSDAVLVELVREPGLRATLDRMVVLGVPSQTTALRALAAWTGPTASPAALERAARLSWAREVRRSLDAGLGGDMLARSLGDRLDQDNLLAMLRLWSNLPSPDRARVHLPDHLLPGGRIGADTLAFAWSRREAGEVVAALLPAVWQSWHGALQRWVDAHDLSVLADVLDELRARWALGLFVRGDPLSLAVPLAFCTALEIEARNLRIIAYGADLRLPPDIVRSRLWTEETAWAA